MLVYVCFSYIHVNAAMFMINKLHFNHNYHYNSTPVKEHPFDHKKCYLSDPHKKGSIIILLWYMY